MKTNGSGYFKYSGAGYRAVLVFKMCVWLYDRRGVQIRVVILNIVKQWCRLCLYTISSCNHMMLKGNSDDIHGSASFPYGTDVMSKTGQIDEWLRWWRALLKSAQICRACAEHGMLEKKRYKLFGLLRHSPLGNRYRVAEEARIRFDDSS